MSESIKHEYTTMYLSRDTLKAADIIPCHKKDNTSKKTNYKPISLLPTILNVF